ncbi:transcriptional regulator [Candidatus Poribacteria bacterium]|nr:MAG: transcriptional regulator [Candidatus Poribacteria bacterium]
MNPIRIFISSVQTEFAQEREALRDYLRGDPLMRRFFDVFLFEDVPASDRRPDSLYLDEVEQSDIYVGLFGDDYGSEDADGISPTEREFDQATASSVHRLIFVKGTNDNNRHPKMQALIHKAQAGLIRKRFNTSEELVIALYAALVEYLDSEDLIRSEPFDAAPCLKASLDDLDIEQMRRFIRIARGAREFPLTEGTSTKELLGHLNLLNGERPTNAAVLAFGKAPQQFLISSEVKCAHFHGTEVAKPIPSYQVYKGTAFQLVDQAVDFVLSKIALSVGTRAESTQAPVSYEIPKEVVREAIVNAVAHRDYTSNASVQVMLFSDRLEVLNPGRLPPPLTLEQLRDTHPSVPNNRLLARSLYLTQYIEEMGTGTLDMIRQCGDAGLREPEFTDSGGFKTTIWRAKSTEQIKVQPVSLRGELKSRVLNLLTHGPMSRSKLSQQLGHKEISGQLNKVVRELLTDKMIEYTLPEKPTSPRQQYRLTDNGRTELANLKSRKAD